MKKTNDGLGVGGILPYSNWRDLEMRLIWIYEGVPIRVSGRFQNSESSAWLILRGRLEIEGVAQTIGPGEWVFAPRRSHQREFSGDAQIISVKFALRWPDGRLLFDLDEVLTARAASCPKLERTVRPLLKYVQRNQLEAGNLMYSQSLRLEQFIHIERLFETWLLAYLEVMVGLGATAYLSRREDTRIVKIQRDLDAHALKESLNLNEVAAGVGLSLGHADMLFNQSHGQTMRGYYDQRRYHTARHWLERTQSPMKEIAFNLGFKDASAFSHWFKKHTKLAPRHYRDSQQSGALS